MSIPLPLRVLLCLFAVAAATPLGACGGIAPSSEAGAGAESPNERVGPEKLTPPPGGAPDACPSPTWCSVGKPPEGVWSCRGRVGSESFDGAFTVGTGHGACLLFPSPFGSGPIAGGEVATDACTCPTGTGTLRCDFTEGGRRVELACAFAAH